MVRNRQWFALRFALPVLAISALLLAMGVTGAIYVQGLQKAESKVLADHVTSIVAAERLVLAIRELRMMLTQYSQTGDPAEFQKLSALREDRDRWLAEAERMGGSPRELRLLKSIRSGNGQFDHELSKLLEGERQPPSRKAVRQLAAEMLTDGVLPPAYEFLDENEHEVALSSTRNAALADRLSYGLLGVGTLGAVAGVVAGYGMSRALRRSMIQLSLPIRDVAGKLKRADGTMTISADPGFENLETVLQEISQRVTAVVEQLHQSQAEALRAEQLAAVGQLAAGLAHELRNPLTSMKILIQSALSADDDATVVDRDDLAVIDQEVTRLEELIGTFLNFARPPRPERRPMVLRDLIEQTDPLIARRASSRGVGIRCEFPAEKLVIRADAGQMRQLLLNLVLNAIEAVPTGGEVVIRIERQATYAGSSPQNPDAGAGRLGWLRLTVSDTGKGLPAALGDRIFEPFVTTTETGLGLGLSICKRITEAHGGTITAASRPEGGAVFAVTLPLDSIIPQEALAYVQTGRDRR